MRLRLRMPGIEASVNAAVRSRSRRQRLDAVGQWREYQLLGPSRRALGRRNDGSGVSGSGSKPRRQRGARSRGVAEPGRRGPWGRIGLGGRGRSAAHDGVSLPTLVSHSQNGPLGHGGSGKRECRDRRGHGLRADREPLADGGDGIPQPRGAHGRGRSGCARGRLHGRHDGGRGGELGQGRGRTGTAHTPDAGREHGLGAVVLLPVDAERRVGCPCRRRRRRDGHRHRIGRWAGVRQLASGDRYRSAGSVACAPLGRPLRRVGCEPLDPTHADGPGPRAVDFDGTRMGPGCERDQGALGGSQSAARRLRVRSGARVGGGGLAAGPPGHGGFLRDEPARRARVC